MPFMIERLRRTSPAILRGVGVVLVAVGILAGVVWLVSRGQSEAAIGLGALAFAALTVWLGYFERTQALRQALYEKRLEIYPELLTAVLKVEGVASEATLFQVVENAEGQELDDDQRRTINVQAGPSSAALWDFEQRWQVIMSRDVAAALKCFREELWELTGNFPASATTRERREENITGDPAGYLMDAQFDIVQAIRRDLGVDRLTDEMLRSFGAHRSRRSK
jgi:hypothetical protein